MSRIFWDTNLFIYLFDKHPEFFAATFALRERMLERKDELVTSSMTLAEIQVKPRKDRDITLAERYRNAITQIGTVVPFDDTAADIFAELRATTSIKAPDAIQMSCAAAAGVELFVTNDMGLHKFHVQGIHFISPLTRLPL